MRKLIDKHKTLINWYQKKFKLSDYQLLWLVFFKGVLITIIFFKIFYINKPFPRMKFSHDLTIFNNRFPN